MHISRGADSTANRPVDHILEMRGEFREAQAVVHEARRDSGKEVFAFRRAHSRPQTLPLENPRVSLRTGELLTLLEGVACVEAIIGMTALYFFRPDADECALMPCIFSMEGRTAGKLGYLLSLRGLQSGTLSSLWRKTEMGSMLKTQKRCRLQAGCCFNYCLDGLHQRRCCARRNLYGYLSTLQA